MSAAAVLLVSLALSVDAFAVAVAGAAVLAPVTWRQSLRLGWHFGFFQAGMTALGWTIGSSLRDCVEAFAHWAAFGLLAIVGGHMIRAGLAPGSVEREARDVTRGSAMVLVSVATSLDALAVGASLSMLQVHILQPALVIGGVALTLTVIGTRLGGALGAVSRLGARAGVFAGMVLIGIGLKMLCDHNVFAALP